MLIASLFIAFLAALVGASGRSAADERRSDLAAGARSGHLDF